MKTNLLITKWLTILTFSIISLQLSTAHAQGTAFTYQGQLQNNGSPASGTYNMEFSLFNTNSSGVPIVGPVTNNAVSISNGLFTVLVDFGSGVFTGETNWLQIGVETNGVNTFTTLAPRQQLTPTPYAIYAESASGLSGTLSASQLTSIGNTNGGTGNFFVGPAGNSTTYANFNTAIGLDALYSNTGGGRNEAIGYNALYDNTTGSYNVAEGGGALSGNTSGSDNTANGDLAMYANNTGSNNTANGAEALFRNRTGSYNTAEGAYSLFSNTNGTYNIALGYQAGYAITTGTSNIDIGNMGQAGDNSIIRIGSGQTQTFIAGVISGNGGGLTSLNASQLTSIGNTDGGSGNFFVGPSGNSTTSGSGNTANGYQALYYNLSGSYNTADGYQALYWNYNANGWGNTAIGYQALYNNNYANAPYFGDGGLWNTGIGYQALYANATGNGNVAIGYQALQNAPEGSANIAIGWGAGANYNGEESDNIVIGNAGVTGDADFIRIGTPGVQSATYLAGMCYSLGYKCLQGTSGTTYGNTFNFWYDTEQAGLDVFIDSTLVAFISGFSDRRLKEDIQPVGDDALRRVMALKPSTFKYKSIPGTIFQGDGQTKEEGFIADELQEVIPSAVNGKKDALTSEGTIQPQTVNIVPVVAVLTKAVQEQQQTIQQQQQQISELKAMVMALSERK